VAARSLLPMGRTCVEAEENQFALHIEIQAAKEF